MDNAVNEFEYLNRPFSFEIISEECKILNEPFIRERRSQMLKIFVKLRQLEACHPGTTLDNADWYIEAGRIVEEILNLLEIIFKIDDLILKRLRRCFLNDVLGEEVYCAFYKSRVREKIESFSHRLFSEDSSPSVNSVSHGSDTVSARQIADGSCLNVTIAKSLVNLHKFLDPVPDLLRPHMFDGKQKNKLAFKKFMDKFIFVIHRDKNLKDGFKLLYLQYYLGGDALEVINDLPINNENYVVAQNMLKEKYLDKEYVINNYLQRIAKIIPPPESAVSRIKFIILTIRSYILELQFLGIDFLEPGSLALTLASYIVFEKLPSQFKRSLITKVSCNYPTLNHIFEHYRSIL